MDCANPKHIEGYVVRMDEKNNKFFETYVSDFAFYYTIKCKCGNEKFHVIGNECPIVTVECCECGEGILVYDLIYYPAATSVDRHENFVKLVLEENDIFEVCVLYEYSDEFELDDEEFDPNNLSWCQVFVRDPKSGEVWRILNDETA